MSLSIYQIVFILYFSLVLFYFFQRNYYKVLLLLVFSIPFKSIYLVIGGAYLELYKGISLLLLPVTFFHIYLKKQPRYFIFLFLFFINSVIVTFVMGFFCSENIIIEGGVFKDNLRPLSQVLLMSAFLNLFFVFKIIKDGDNKSITFIKTYIIAVVTCVFLAFIQWIVYKKIGYNLFPILRLSGEFTEARLYSLEVITSQDFFRLNGLSMEPKNLASHIAFVLIIIFGYWTTCRRCFFNKYIDFVIVILSIFVLFYTYSSLGYLIFILGLIYIILSAIKTGKRFCSLLLALLIFFGTSYTILKNNPDVLEILRVRTIERIWNPDMGLMLEHFDEATNNFFKENIAYLISGVGWGNIHKFAKDYLPASADFAYNSAWMPNSGILYLLAGSGVIGAILFFQFFRKVLSWPNLIKNHNSQEKYLKQIVIFALLTFIVRNNEILFFLTGVYILYKSSYLKQEQLKNRGKNEH